VDINLTKSCVHQVVATMPGLAEARPHGCAMAAPTPGTHPTSASAHNFSCSATLAHSVSGLFCSHEGPGDDIADDLALGTA